MVCALQQSVYLHFIEGEKRMVTCDFKSEYACGYDLAPHNFDGVVWKWKNDGKFARKNGIRTFGKHWMGVDIVWLLKDV